MKNIKKFKKYEKIYFYLNISKPKSRSNRRGRQTGYPWHQLEYATGVGGFDGIPLGVRE